MRRNIVKEKSFEFALLIIDICRYLKNQEKEFELSSQLLKSGTAIGALIREAEHAESRADFIHKLSISRKEANETLYWIELLHASDLIDSEEYAQLEIRISELLKILTAIILTAKKKSKTY